MKEMRKMPGPDPPVPPEGTTGLTEMFSTADKMRRIIPSL